MSKPCAYCKELGHHIKFCVSLKDKNRRKDSGTEPKPKLNAVITKIQAAVKPLKKNNIFRDLYSSSSDDEIEEGEIVEFDRHNRFGQFLKSEVISEAESVGLPRKQQGEVQGFSTQAVSLRETKEFRRENATNDSDSDSSSWKRRSTNNNTNVIYIPCVKKLEDDDQDENYPIYNYEPCPFLEKYKGMSWAEIEYYSESD